MQALPTEKPCGYLARRSRKARRGVRVGRVDVGEIDAQFLGEDLRRAGHRAAPELDSAAHHGHRAVGLIFT